MNTDEFIKLALEKSRIEDDLYHFITKLKIPISSKMWDAWDILRETILYDELFNN